MGLISKIKSYAGVMSQRKRPMQAMELLRKRRALMLGYGGFETAQFVSNRVDGRLKTLAVVKTSALVGCPF